MTCKYCIKYKSFHDFIIKECNNGKKTIMQLLAGTHDISIEYSSKQIVDIIIKNHFPKEYNIHSLLK